MNDCYYTFRAKAVGVNKKKRENHLIVRQLNFRKLVVDWPSEFHSWCRSNDKIFQFQHPTYIFSLGQPRLSVLGHRSSQKNCPLHLKSDQSPDDCNPMSAPSSQLDAKFSFHLNSDSSYRRQSDSSAAYANKRRHSLGLLLITTAITITFLRIVIHAVQKNE